MRPARTSSTIWRRYCGAYRLWVFPIDGLEVAQRIREEHLPTEPLILMLSSDDLKPQLSRLKELGLDAYLVKPITRKELFDPISRVIKSANRNSIDALPERKAENGPAPEYAPDGHKISILVADDSSDNRLLIGAARNVRRARSRR